MEQIGEEDRVRIDIPDESDPDHDRFHGKHGQVTLVFEDAGAKVTGDAQDDRLYRVELDSGETEDFRRRDLRPPLDP